VSAVSAAALRAEMVETQLRRRGIVDPEVLRAFGEVPREAFVPGVTLEEVYADRPVKIGYGQTISQPYVLALMCQLLGVRSGHWALEVGAGSGYAAAILASLGAKVVALERIAPLALGARERLDDAGFSETVEVLVADGSEGCPEKAPFDRILVSAGAPSMPRTLVSELAPGGVLVAPVGPKDAQELTVVRRTPSGDRVETYGPCAFVKLVGRAGWGYDDGDDRPGGASER